MNSWHRSHGTRQRPLLVRVSSEDCEFQMHQKVDILVYLHHFQKGTGNLCHLQNTELIDNILNISMKGPAGSRVSLMLNQPFLDADVV